jgi:hypothetical protein
MGGCCSLQQSTTCICSMTLPHRDTSNLFSRHIKCDAVLSFHAVCKTRLVGTHGASQTADRSATARQGTEYQHKQSNAVTRQCFSHNHAFCATSGWGNVG